MTTAFTVLGMHKSGTTLLSQILHASGIGMIEAADSRSYDEGNHFEREATNELNKDLLHCGRANSLRVITRYCPGEGHTAAVAKARAIAADIAKSGDWGFKDPRSCLTYSLWAEALPDLKVICVFRAASSVRRHYTVGKPFALNRGLRALRAWHIYNSAMLDAYDTTPAQNRLMLEYETLLQDAAELNRVESFVGRPVHDSRLPWLNRRANTIVSWRELIERAVLKLAFGLDVTALEVRLAETFAANCRSA